MSVIIENCEKGAKFLLVPTAFSNTVDWILHHKHLSSNKISCGGICTCTGISFILIQRKNFIYVFDSHSCDSKGVHVPNGQRVQG